VSDPMPDESTPATPPEAALPEIHARRGISIVWIIPIVAALIGLWLGVRAWRENGPVVTITFEGAEGLEAGKTRIRFKDVEVGRVEAIHLSPDRTHVVVNARMERDAEDFLKTDSRFWVVRARISLNQVSGLGTLFSGAYIGVDPGHKGSRASEFKGLEAPPVVTTSQPGRSFLLRAERLGSMDIGSPIHYRQIRVGEIMGYELAPDGQSVGLRAFIHAPYSDLVREETRFWLEGGVDFSLDANGVRLSTEPLATLMLGGIAFETPVTLESNGPAKEGRDFPLYDSHEKIFEKTYLEKQYYVLNFSESVRGLTRGAPVEFRGIKVGEVSDIKLEFHSEQLEVRIPVLISLEPERLTLKGRHPGASVTQAIEQLVERGLRGQLKTGSFITGQLFVDLDLYPSAPPRKLDSSGPYPQIPTVPTTLGTVTASITEVFDRVRKLPLEEVMEELKKSIPALRETVLQARKLMVKADEETLPQAKATLEQAQKTLAQADRVLSADAPVQQDLRRTLQEAEKASRSLKILTDYLELHPDALIFGKGKEKEKK